MISYNAFNRVITAGEMLNSRTDGIPIVVAKRPGVIPVHPDRPALEHLRQVTLKCQGDFRRGLLDIPSENEMSMIR